MWSSSDKGIKLWAHDRFITAIWRINPAMCLRHISHIWSLFKHLLSGISNIQFPVKSILSTHDLKKKDSEALENNLNSPSITARMNDGIYTVCVLLVWVYIGLCTCLQGVGQPCMAGDQYFSGQAIHPDPLWRFSKWKLLGVQQQWLWRPGLWGHGETTGRCLCGCWLYWWQYTDGG